MTLSILDSPRRFFRLEAERVGISDMSTYNSIFSGIISKIAVEELCESNVVRIVFRELNFIKLHYALSFIELFTLILF